MNQRKTENSTPNIRNFRLIILSVLPLLFIWLLSLRPVRLFVGDYYFNKANFGQAANWYCKIARTEKLKGICREETLTKFTNACSNSASFHFGQSKKYLSTNMQLAEGELKKVIGIYKFLFRNAQDSSIIGLILPLHTEFFPNLKKACIDLATIYKLQKPEKCFELYKDFLDLQTYSKDFLWEQDWSAIYSSLLGMNLLENPYLTDLNNDGIPDGYTYACSGPDATSPHKECIKTKNYNIYHVWQEKGRGWFATYFHIGRIPPHTYFTFSIDIKRVNIEGVAQGRLYTTRLSDGNWGAGHDYSETGVFIDLKDGWKREFHTIKTKDYSDILLSGWIAGWDYGQAGGHIYVCKPKLEIGNKPTL